MLEMVRELDDMIHQVQKVEFSPTDKMEIGGAAQNLLGAVFSPSIESRTEIKTQELADAVAELYYKEAADIGAPGKHQFTVPYSALAAHLPVSKFVAIISDSVKMLAQKAGKRNLVPMELPQNVHGDALGWYDDVCVRVVSDYNIAYDLILMRFDVLVKE